MKERDNFADHEIEHCESSQKNKTMGECLKDALNLEIKCNHIKPPEAYVFVTIIQDNSKTELLWDEKG